MPMSWNDSLATGVADIDDQHKELFHQLSRLHEAMSRGTGPDEISSTLDFLGDYVVNHFATEEKHMDDVGCPAAAANKQAHSEFLAMFEQYRRRFEQSGGSPALVLDIANMISRWLVDHIMKIDIRLKTCVVSTCRPG